MVRLETEPRSTFAEFGPGLYWQVLAALVAVQLIRIAEGVCRVLIFTSGNLSGGLPLSLWWTAIDVRASFCIMLAPLLAAIIFGTRWPVWQRALAHLALLGMALLVDGRVLHRVAHTQAVTIQRLLVASTAEQAASAAASSGQSSAPSPRRVALLRAYEDANDRVPAGARYWISELMLLFTYYLSMAILGFAVYYFRISEFRTRQAERLRRTLVELRHESLCNRLTHHFLFNTFNTISALTLSDNRAARTCISQLSDLLRASIDTLPQGEVRLDKELDTLGIYLAIQKTRFGEKLDYSLDVERGLDSAMVPAFLLQPLVENCFEHGFREHVTVARIRVLARREGDRCVLEVTDNGVPVVSPDAIDENFGLGITRERLTLQYGAAAEIWYESNHPSGLRVCVAVPFRLECAADA